MTFDRKEINLLVIAITLLAVGLLVWTYIGQWEARNPGASMATNANNNPIQILPAGQIPASMPQNIVLDKNAKVLSSYTGTTSQGKIQSVVAYTSKESTGAIINIYGQYFAKNGWLAVIPASTVKAMRSGYGGGTITASKVSSTITVAVLQNSSSSTTNLVSIIMNLF